MKMWALVACALFIATPLYAQIISISPGIDTSVTAELSPQSPEPGALVRVTLKSSVIDLSNASVVWRINDSIVRADPDATTLEIRAGELGSQTTVTAEIATDVAEASVRAIVVPTEMDVLWESDSFTPHFYRGRALPSAGSTIRLQAFPRFKTVAGKDIAAGTLVYTWKRNGAPIQSISGVGKSRATMAAPGLFGNDTITVEARTPDGLLSSEKTVRIASVEPALTLYKVHPLFGTMFNAALTPNAEIPDQELSFVAIPYFADVSSADDPALRFNWSVNERDVRADPKKPSIITIDASGSTGIARISIALSHASNLFLKAVGNWTLTFTNVTESIDPFRPTE